VRLEREASYRFKLAVSDGVTPEPDKPVTVRAWLRKNGNYAGAEPAITLRGPGMDGTGAAAAAMSAAADTWEQLSVTGTPDSNGVATLQVETFSAAGNAMVWIDDITCSQ
jgi:hypothetical protein